MPARQPAKPQISFVPPSDRTVIVIRCAFTESGCVVVVGCAALIVHWTVCVLCVGAVLDRLRSFLPKMKEANVELEHAIRNQAPDEYNIENVDDDEQHIEMVRAIASPAGLCCEPVGQRAVGGLMVSVCTLCVVFGGGVWVGSGAGRV